ncbi:MAG TPA: nitrilase, partial [Alicyclobacillus sp.]|nr:nitrilase [Alicyclobacillus sp.]
SQYVTKEMYRQDLYGQDDLENFPEEISRGGTAIVDPFGQYVEGPLYSREGILYADLDLGVLDEAHYEFDPIGHYSRPVVFRLVVNEPPQR